MGKQKNRKRKTKKSKHSNLILKVKTFCISLSLGALAALGLWRCLGDESGAVLEPFEDEKNVTNVDVGKGNTPDPTLVNEQKLLKSEEKQLKPPPEPEEEPEQEQEQEQEEEKIEEETDSDALEEAFPNYAVAYHFHTQMKNGPEDDARVVGYARRGAKFRVSERISTKGCSKGWYEIVPGGTFVCNGKGVIVSDEPVDFSPSPVLPNLEAAMPYKYVYVQADNTPQYWRVPTSEETVSVKSLFEKLRKRDVPAPEKSEVKTEEKAPEKAEEETKKKTEESDEFKKALENAAAAALEAVKSAEEAVEEAEEAQPEKSEEVAQAKPEVAVAADGGVVDPYALPPYVYQRMKKGYFVSTDGKTNNDSGTYVRTVRGRYILANKLIDAKPSTFEGLLTKGVTELPRVFNVGGGVKLLKRETQNGPLKSDAKINRLTHYPFVGELTRRNRRYVQVGEDVFLSSRVAAVARTVEPPKKLKENERWIDIDLSEQTLVAYEGEVPVFATLISSGRKGFETPEGEFRIYSKHVSITMDDPDGGEEAYSIEDVPWTQYFEDSYALHAAFWHNRFGRVRSHGCINLAPADARRLFFWTGPHLPEGLHGIASTRENPGTRVVIHK